MIYIFFLLTIMLISIVSMKPLNQFDDEYLSLQNTIRLKGISAIWIVIHHVSQIVSFGHISQIIGGVGGLFTSLFLFISGYGMMYSLCNKKNYLSSYYKRILQVMIPYWFIDVLLLVYFLIFDNQFNIMHWVVSLMTIQIAPKIATYWFICAILVMYISFFLSLKLTDLMNGSKSISIGIMIFFTSVYSFVCVVILKLPGAYTSTIFSFVLGMIWNQHNSEILSHIKNHYLRNLSITIISFLLLFAAAKVIDNCIFPFQAHLSLILNNLASIAFIFTVMTILQKIKLRGKISLLLGKTSYEIYIVHITCIGIMNNEKLQDKMDGNLFILVFLIFMFLSLIPTYFVTATSKKILKKQT